MKILVVYYSRNGLTKKIAAEDSLDSRLATR